MPGLPNAVASKGATANVSLKLTIPSTTTTQSLRRQPATISSSTQSVVITVNGGLQQTFNVAAPQCSTSPPITCNFIVDAYVGSDTFVISTYSGTNGTGTLLDSATEPFTVSATGSNTFSVELGPVVTTLSDGAGVAGSLRSAIAAASPGDTITFAPGLTGTIALTGLLTLPQNVTISGPGASAISISGGGTTEIFYVNAGVTATISGLTLTDGAAASCGKGGDVCGGAITNEGTLTIAGDAFANNVANPNAYGEGGAIYTDVGATLTVSNSTFTGNTAEFGGAIGSESPNTTVSNSTFNGNAATGSLAVNLGGAIYSDDDITITASTFTSNVAGGGGNYSYGGAIDEDDYTSTGLTISNSQFISNQAGMPSHGDPGGNGGAVYDDSGDTMTLTGNTFGGASGMGNTAAGTSDSFGGAVEASNSSIVVNSGNTFSFNAVTSQSTSLYSAGGAIEVTGSSGDLTITGASTFTSNSVAAGPLATFGGEADGGAIDDRSGGAIDLHAASGTTFTSNAVSTPGDVNGNAFGGAIYYYGDGCELCSKKINPRPMTNRVRPAQTLAGRPKHGTAKAIARQTAHVAGSTRKQILQASAYEISSVTFKSNTATGGTTSYNGAKGGAIYVQQTSTNVTLASSTFTLNSATSGQYGDGGAVELYAGVLELTGDLLENNTATAGGAAIEDVDGTISIATSTISGNTATGDTTQDAGGAVVFYESTFTIVQSTISGNTLNGNLAAGGGGGLAVLNFSSGTITNSTITGNTSGINGGGMLVGGFATATFINDTVYANSTTNANGGGNLFIVSDGGDDIAVIQNTIFYGGLANGAANDVVNNDTLDTNGGNVVGVEAGTGAFGAVPVGAPGDSNLNPQLSGSGLQSNGGPTLTIAATASSPTVSYSGGVCGYSAAITLDQRGYTRGAGNVCNIGAYEFAGVAP